MKYRALSAATTHPMYFLALPDIFDPLDVDDCEYFTVAKIHLLLLPAKALQLNHIMHFYDTNGLKCNDEACIRDELGKQAPLYIDRTGSTAAECRATPVEQCAEPSTFEPEADMVRCKQLYSTAQTERKLR